MIYVCVLGSTFRCRHSVGPFVWGFLGFHAGTWYFVLRKFPPLKRHWKKRNICQHVAFQKATLMDFLPIFLWKTGASKETDRPFGWAGAIRRAVHKGAEKWKYPDSFFTYLTVWVACIHSAPFLCRFTFLYYIHIWVCCNLYLVWRWKVCSTWILNWEIWWRTYVCHFISTIMHR